MTSPSRLLCTLAVLLTSLLLLSPAFVQAQNTSRFLQDLTGHIWSWKSGLTDTQVIFEPDGTMRVKGSAQLSRWQQTNATSVKVTYPNEQNVEITFAQDLMSFIQAGGVAGGVTGSRLTQRTVPAPSQTRAGTPAAPAVRPPPHPTQMSLSADWLPHNVHTRKVLLNSIESYSLEVLGGQRDAAETIPDVIWAGVKWLMPVKDAIAMLPRGARRQREFDVLNLAFPQHSLHVHMWAIEGGQAIPDRCDTFKYISFITDLDQRVIGIQLVNPSPRYVNWESPGPQGVREPYYNFIEDRYNGSTRNCVPYQVLPAGKGVKLIKTALYKQPDLGIPRWWRPGQCPGYSQLPSDEYGENVHWYLTAPLAKNLLEIVDSIRKQGLDDR
jgi:hypothetical protein